MSGETVVINNGFTTRTRTSGKQYTTIDVSAESLVHNLDPKQLGQDVADAIAEHFRQRIAGITATVSAATKRARANAAKALADGDYAAQRRYGGGRIGTMPPNQSDRLFNDSGRLVKSIVARATSAGEWIVNVAGNRLSEAEFGKGFAAMLDRLRPYIDVDGLRTSIPFRRAVENGQRQMIQKQEASISEARDQRARAIVGLAGQIGGAVLRLVG